MPTSRQCRPGTATIRVALWVLALVVVAVVVWLAIWKAPLALAGPVPPDPAPKATDAEIAAAATRYAAYHADVTATRTGMIAGLAALGSLWVTMRTYSLSVQGQLTDRYTNAVAQLGDDKATPTEANLVGANLTGARGLKTGSARPHPRRAHHPAARSGPTRRLDLPPTEPTRPGPRRPGGQQSTAREDRVIQRLSPGHEDPTTGCGPRNLAIEVAHGLGQRELRRE
jgi:hypothetical protein